MVASAKLVFSYKRLLASTYLGMTISVMHNLWLLMCTYIARLTMTYVSLCLVYNTNVIILGIMIPSSLSGRDAETFSFNLFGKYN